MSAPVGEHERLTAYVDKSRGHFSLALARYADEGEARERWEQLTSELHARGCMVALIDFSGAAGDVDVIQRLEAAASDAGALFVVGLEDLLVSEDGQPRATRALVTLNFNRDLLRARVPVPVVLWLSRRGAQAFAMLAPDTFDVLRTSFEFPAEVAPDEREPGPHSGPRRPRWLRLAAQAERPRFEARRDTLRSLYAEASAEPGRAGDLAASLAEACFALGQDDEGDDWLREAAAHHELARNLGAAVTARRQRGELRLFREDFEAARAELDQAWALVESMVKTDDPLVVVRKRPDVARVRSVLESTSASVSNDPELELLRRWHAGDSQAGLRFFNRYYNRIHTYFAASVPDAHVIDLVQETFSRLLGLPPRLEDYSSVKILIYSIARTILRSYRHERQQRDELTTSDNDIIEQLEASRDLYDTLRGLPEQDQELLSLHYLENLSEPELAELIGAPRPTISRQLGRARARLLSRYTELNRLMDEPELELELRELGLRLRDLR